MKTAVVFLLVAVTASYGYVQQRQQPQQPSCGAHGSNPGYGQLPNTNCLEKVLKTDLKNILESARKLICSYENCMETECSLGEWTALLKDTRVLLKDLGCAVDELVFPGEPTVEKIAEEVGKCLETLRDPIRNLLIHLKLEEPLFKTLCSVLGDILLKVADVLGHLDGVLNLAAPVTGLLNVGTGGLSSLGGLGGLGAFGGLLNK